MDLHTLVCRGRVGCIGIDLQAWLLYMMEKERLWDTQNGGFEEREAF